MKVVVTGGAGFIEANVCRALGDTGTAEVIAYDNLSTGYSLNLEGVLNVSRFEADELDNLIFATRSQGRTASCTWLPARPYPGRWPIHRRRMK